MRKGTTVLEMLVFVGAAALLMGVLVAVLGVAKKGSNVMKDSVNQRNILVAMSEYGSGNKSWFPGLTPAGNYRSQPLRGIRFGALPNAGNAKQEATGAGCRIGRGSNLAMAILLEEDRIVPSHLLAPDENGRTSGGPRDIMGVSANPPEKNPTVAPVEGGDPAPGEVRGRHMSHAFLAYGKASLKPEWKDAKNPRAVVMASRLIFGDRGNGFSSILTEEGSGRWKGVLVRGDQSSVVERFRPGEEAGTFGVLTYGSTVPFDNGTESTSVVGIFGRSTDMRNYDAMPATGMIGSVND